MQVEDLDPVEMAAHEIAVCAASFRDAIDKARSMPRALAIRQFVNDAIQELTQVENDALTAAGRLPTR